jgi:hypothetical protein
MLSMSAKKRTAQTSKSLSERPQELIEARPILQSFEAPALSNTALLLAEVADQLSKATRTLVELQPTEWMTAEQAAKYLGCESVKAFEKIASREDIPKHYLSARTPRYNRAELDEWLLGRRGSIHWKRVETQHH